MEDAISLDSNSESDNGKAREPLKVGPTKGGTQRIGELPKPASLSNISAETAKPASVVNKKNLKGSRSVDFSQLSATKLEENCSSSDVGGSMEMFVEEEDAGSVVAKKSFRDRASYFLQLKNSNKLHHRSIELLNNKKIASKTRDIFEETGPELPQSQKNTRISIMLAGKTATSPEAVDSKPAAASPSNLIDHSGFRSSRILLASTSTENTNANLSFAADSQKASTETTASISTMSGLRNNRNSLMPKSVHESPETTQTTPEHKKPFKEWYISMIIGIIC